MDLSSKKSIIETVYLKNEQGNVIEVCFDITDYRKKFNELHKKKKLLKFLEISGNKKERVKEDKEPGSSYDFPIELKDAKTEKEVLEAQKNYLEKKFSWLSSNFKSNMGIWEKVY